MKLAVNDMLKWPDNYKNLYDYSQIIKHAVEGYPTAVSEKSGILLLKKIIDVFSKALQSN